MMYSRLSFFSCVLCLLVSGPIGSAHAYAQDNNLCVGNFWSEDEANLMMKQFRLKWDDVGSWEKRADIVRKGIIEGMKLDRMPDVKGEFNAITENLRIMDGYSVENIAIESFPGFFITGNLYKPLSPKPKNPAILCTHGHKSNRGFTKNLQIRCASLARMGAIVFSYNMVGRNGTDQVSHTIPISLLLQTYNSQRVLEYLISRPDVDSEQIGMTGESGGATQTFILAALDDRVRVSVPVVQVSAHFFGGCVGESGMPIHQSDKHQTNNVEIAALCAPRPMLLISDGEDWTRNTPRVEYPYIRDVYSLYDAEHKVENVHLPTEKHDYGYSKRAAAYVFFSHHLKLDIDQLPYDADKGFLEDFVTVLPSEQLRIFNENNPLPEKALMGNEAVVEYLDLKN